MPGEALSAELSTARKEYLERRQLRRERFEGIQADLEQYKEQQKVKVEKLLEICKKHIHNYSQTQECSRINKALRTGTINEARRSVRQDIRGVGLALRLALTGLTETLKPYEGGCLYRGSGPIPEEPVAGGIFCDQAFLSTTSNKQSARSFLQGKRRDKTRYLFKILKHSTGIDIQKLSHLPFEEEKLFPPSTWFRVVSVDPAYSLEEVTGTITLVEMEEISVV